MTPTPNTPASADKAIADFAREAVSRISKNLYLEGTIGYESPAVDESEATAIIQSAIAKAIERDRAERAAVDAARESLKNINALADVIEERDELKKRLSEREAELAENARRFSSLWRWCERRRVDERDDQTIESMLDDLCERLTDRYESAKAKLAEQSAALDAAKDALLAAGSYYEWDGAGENEPCVVKQRAALAQIEALAGKGAQS